MSWLTQQSDAPDKLVEYRGFVASRYSIRIRLDRFALGGCWSFRGMTIDPGHMWISNRDVETAVSGDHDTTALHEFSEVAGG